MDTGTGQSHPTVAPPGIVQPLRHRQPSGASAGKLFDPDLAEPYFEAARAAFDEPASVNHRAVAVAAFYLATCYTSGDLLTKGGSPREARAG